MEEAVASKATRGRDALIATHLRSRELDRARAAVECAKLIHAQVERLREKAAIDSRAVRELSLRVQRRAGLARSAPPPENARLALEL